MGRALITGATSGLGAEFARQLAARGDDLVLVARDVARLRALADELAGCRGVQVEVLAADLAQRSDVQQVAERLASEDEPIDLLINNAGFGTTTSLIDADLTEHERALDVMAKAVMLLGGAAGRAMKERGEGRILNVASLSAWITSGDYSAIKAYVLAYSAGLGNALHGTGVTVTALCPGWVRTEFHERAGMATSTTPDAVWVDAARCVRDALADAEAGKAVSVPTKRWKAARVGLTAAPAPLVRWMSRRLDAGRTPTDRNR